VPRGRVVASNTDPTKIGALLAFKALCQERCTALAIDTVDVAVNCRLPVRRSEVDLSVVHESSDTLYEAWPAPRRN